MRRDYLNADFLAGVVMFVVAIGVCVPAIVLGATRIPLLVWAALLVLFLISCLGSVLELGPLRRWNRFSLVIGVLSSWTLMLTSDVELVNVLAIITAAVSVHVVPRMATAAIIALNTVVIISWSAVAGAGNSWLIFGGFYLLIQLATVFSAISQVREREMRLELAEAHVELQAASVLLVNSTRVEERLRISRELHDLIGHQLAVLTLHLEAARHLEGEQARENVNRADAVARDLLRDVRATVGALRTDPSDLESVLGKIATGLPGLDVELHVDAGLEPTEEQAHAAIRFAQETITNAVRHGSAEHLSLDLSSQGENYLMVAADDGYGDDQPVLGNGLRGLAERFEALGGELTVDGRDGFRVTGTVPATSPIREEVSG